jgi:hypothetical protein
LDLEPHWFSKGTCPSEEPIHSCIQSGIQNPRCPPGGNLEFWVALVFEGNLPLVDLNPQKTMGASVLELFDMTETKAGHTYIPGGHLGFWWHYLPIHF